MAQEPALFHQHRWTKRIPRTGSSTRRSLFRLHVIWPHRPDSSSRLRSAGTGSPGAGLAPAALGKRVGERRGCHSAARCERTMATGPGHRTQVLRPTPSWSGSRSFYSGLAADLSPFLLKPNHLAWPGEGTGGVPRAQRRCCHGGNRQTHTRLLLHCTFFGEQV